MQNSKTLDASKIEGIFSEFKGNEQRTEHLKGKIKNAEAEIAAKDSQIKRYHKYIEAEQEEINSLNMVDNLLFYNKLKSI